MRKVRRLRGLPKTVLIIAMFSLAGSVLFLLTWDMSPSIKKIERIIPDERFPK